MQDLYDYNDLPPKELLEQWENDINKSYIIESESNLKKAIIAQNKNTMKKIANKIQKLAWKEAEAIRKKTDYKYLCDNKYTLYNQDVYYYLDPDDEEGQDYFGEFSLLDINLSLSKLKIDDPSEFDWNDWESKIFDIVRAINKNPEISKYGNADTEQPDDGDSIRFTIKREFLKVQDDFDEKNNTRKANEKKAEDDQKKKNEIFAKNKNKILQSMKPAINEAKSGLNSLKLDSKFKNKKITTKEEFDTDRICVNVSFSSICKEQIHEIYSSNNKAIGDQLEKLMDNLKDKYKDFSIVCQGPFFWNEDYGTELTIKIVIIVKSRDYFMQNPSLLESVDLSDISESVIYNF